MNPYQILVPTIPHTGTHFMRDHLLKEPGLARVEHIYPNSCVDLEAIAKVSPTIIPLRHPLLVAESWKRRAKDVFELPMWWSNLVTYFDPHGPFYLCLDKPEIRDGQLADINRDLEMELETNWPVLREMKTPRGPHKLSTEEACSVAETAHALRHFFSRWYE